MTTARILFLCAALFALLGPAHGADWPQWRGPAFDGSSPEAGLPADWGTNQCVRWGIKLPGAGSSTPVICGDRVYLTCWDAAENALRALCLDAASGKELWRYDAGPGFKPKGGNTGATPSAAADGQRVIFLFGTGLMVALDPDGKPLWKRSLAAPGNALGPQFGYGGSPLLFEGRIFLPLLMDAERPSRVLCLDAASGRDLWTRERITDAVLESHDAYTTPCPFRQGGASLVLIAGGDYITAHEPQTGREAWRSPSFNPEKDGQCRLIPTPVCAGSNVVCSVNRGRVLLSFSGEAAARKEAAGWQWQSGEWAADISSPLFYRGRLYALAGDSKRIACLDPATGAPLWSGSLGSRGKFFSSPTAADGRIYCISVMGEVFVLSAGPAFKILNKVDFAESCSGASVAIARRSLFIRTTHRLYCIGAEDARQP